jgi:hypothetical protein
VKTMQLKRLMNRNAVLLALHWLSDDDGLTCGASNEQIAAAARRSKFLTAETLRDLGWYGEVTKFDGRDGLSSRRFVLMSHPEAKAIVRHIRRAYGRPAPRSRKKGA